MRDEFVSPFPAESNSELKMMMIRLAIALEKPMEGQSLHWLLLVRSNGEYALRLASATKLGQSTSLV